MEFHNMNKMRKEAKVYLVGRDEEGEEKVVTEWEIGVPIESITKSISKHRYKKFVKSVNFWLTVTWSSIYYSLHSSLKSSKQNSLWEIQ